MAEAMAEAMEASAGAVVEKEAPEDGVERSVRAVGKGASADAGEAPVGTAAAAEALAEMAAAVLARRKAQRAPAMPWLQQLRRGPR